MSVQCDLFMEELKQLMDKYNIALYTSLYDSIHVRRIDTTFQSKEDVINYSIENFVDEVGSEH